MSSSQKPAPPATAKPARDQAADRAAQAMVDALNRNAMAEHEADLAMLPPDVRASRTEEQWLATPPLEILKLVGKARPK